MRKMLGLLCIAVMLMILSHELNSCCGRSDASDSVITEGDSIEVVDTLVVDSVPVGLPNE